MAAPPPADPYAGYAGFGSFHSDNVQGMIEAAAAAGPRWAAPVPAPVPVPAPPGPPPAFGEACRPLFLVDFAEWTFLNHGAFGAPCRLAFDHAAAWRLHAEAQPLRFIDRQLFPATVAALHAFAGFVGADPRDLVFLPNATAGLNVVINSAGLGPGDSVYCLDVGYGSVRKMLAAACSRAGARVLEQALDLEGADDGGTELTPEAIVDLVERTLPAGPGRAGAEGGGAEGDGAEGGGAEASGAEAIAASGAKRPRGAGPDGGGGSGAPGGCCRLAIFDGVTSNTGLALPLPALIAACHAKGVPVLIDGAHLLGSAPLDLGTLGADYVVSNLHKWFCGVRGAGFLWARRPLQAALQPAVLSHGARDGFLSAFIWDGCRDYAPVLSVPAALRFWGWLGGPEAVLGYQRKLLAEATQLLVARWGTGTLAPVGLCAAMALVRLPAGLRAGAPVGAEAAHAKAVQDWLHEAHRIEVPVKNVRLRLYVRISCHVYNTLADYERLAGVVRSCERIAALLPAAPRAGVVCTRGGACG